MASRKQAPEAAPAAQPAQPTSPEAALAQWQAYAEQQRARAEQAEEREQALKVAVENLKTVQAALELRLREAELPKRIYCFGRANSTEISQRVRASSEAAARAQLPPGQELQFRGCQG